MMSFLRKVFSVVLAVSFFLSVSGVSYAQEREDERADNMKELQEKFSWWPTDAKPGPVKDEEKGGYWWMPTTPGKMRPWGNRGYVYVYKIIFDYKEEELPPPKPQELRPSLLVKKIVKNVKVYFDYNKADIREDAVPVLQDGIRALKKNQKTNILITGNCDVRGSDEYNMKLGKKRADAVLQYMLDNGVPAERIRIVSRGKLEAIAPVSDLVGMQKDRNAQFMVAEVEEVMMPYQGEAPQGAAEVGEGKYIQETTQEVQGAIKVSTRDYTIQKGDSLWKIAQEQMGSGYRWKYLYEQNKERIKNPDKLKAGVVIKIPVE
jgi:outer membrane protein OmpA-like peptidoglycan-associated protein